MFESPSNVSETVLLRPKGWRLSLKCETPGCKLQVHHGQSFKAPGNTAAAMLGACCYRNIDPQLARGAFPRGGILLSPVTRLTIPRLEGNLVEVVTTIMMKQYRSVVVATRPAI